MKKTYCDICGREIEKDDKVLDMSIQRLERFCHGSIIRAEYTTYKVTDKFEICEYCQGRMLACIKGMTAPWLL